ncbi:MAG: hypothetical protein JWL76_2203 [Thermoleophilia bacterium]|nr:hypothetical protein [Thermoleophilia bacterium]
MTIGASIFLLAVGLILALAVDVAPTAAGTVSIEWDVVGWILVCAGLLGLALSLYMGRRRVIYSDPAVPPTRTTTVIEDERYPPVP